MIVIIKMIRLNKLTLEELIMSLTIFFIPYTAFRIMGLKISEISMIILMIVMLLKGEAKISKKNNSFNFVVFICICIFVSGVLGLIDPINQYVYGKNEGIYYSFEFGWIFKIVRFIIVWFFSLYFMDKVKEERYLKKYFNIYILSCLLLDIWGIIMAVKNGIVAIGVTRTALAAVEPAEAGFINCFGIICALFMLYKHRELKYIFSGVVMIIGQLIIGSTSSIVCMVGAIIVATLYLINMENHDLAKKIILYIVGGACITVAVFYLINRTTLLDKIINYRTYLTIRGSSVAERITTIQTCWKIFCARPILGIGFGNFGWYIKHYVTSPLLNYVPGGSFQPNCLYFELLAELGIVGFLGYLVFIKKILFKIMQIIKVEKSNYSFLFLATLVYILIHNFTLTTIYSFQFWMVVACVLSCRKRKEKD